MGQLVDFQPDGETARGYLATGEGAGPGLIVIDESWGLVRHIEDVCDRFAAEGFTAFAPDLYHGKTVPSWDPDEGRTAAMALAMPQAAQDLSGAIDYLVGHSAVRGHGVGVVGFSVGGGLALWLASLRPDQVRAVVPFYGTVGQDAPPDWDNLTAPVEGHYGELDPAATPERAKEIEHELVERGREVRMFFYPNVGHAFFDDTRPETYSEDAARQAWVRTLEFLRAKLG